ncbi:thioredoxin family protein [uncultured Nocardioides sp.]|uniref:thioredoxin family protein n=1 Tax=uncultured Nocardioides sp. TaxID=198441 RepID=UPI0025F15E92|nr:thioredoxin family protein [uncultured Nocardioides sp.]
MTTGAWVLVAAVTLSAVFGGWRLRVDGRFRGAPVAEAPETPEEEPAPSLLARTPYDDRLGERATLLQFSSAFCAPCRTTRVVLADIAGVVPGVAHVEVDAEQHLDLVRRVGITRTPTTLVLDRAGHEVTRAAGAPTRQQVLTALAGTA